MYGIIYCITNKVNGKQYIGITTRALSRRFNEHCKADSYIGKSIRKHGVENFSIQIIDSAFSQEELHEKEMTWIEKLETFGNGYNLTMGGDGIRVIQKLEIKLTDKQQKFVDFVNKENKKPIDVKNANEMARMIVINTVYFYLMADYESVKKRAAATLLRLKTEFQEAVYNLNLFDEEELLEYSTK